MRKLETASKAEGSVRKESCNHEEVTAFYDTALREEQINVGTAIGSRRQTVLEFKFTPLTEYFSGRERLFGLSFCSNGLNCCSEQYNDNVTVKGVTR